MCIRDRYYANVGQFAEEILRLANDQAQPPLSRLCVEAAAIGDIDFSAATTLRDTCTLLKQQDILLVFANEMCIRDRRKIAAARASGCRFSRASCRSIGQRWGGTFSPDSRSLR